MRWRGEEELLSDESGEEEEEALAGCDGYRDEVVARHVLVSGKGNERMRGERGEKE